MALHEGGESCVQKICRTDSEKCGGACKRIKKLGWRIISQGTDSHLILVDVWMDGKGISGKEASDNLESAGIIVNKNTIPGETRTPSDPSGIRLGTAAERPLAAKRKRLYKNRAED